MTMQNTVGEKYREEFEKETGKQWMTNPVTHGELGFASWEYQLWLESRLAEAEKENVERLAKLMLSMELATGHGDDWDSLALELRTQWEELRSRCIAAEKESEELKEARDEYHGLLTTAYYYLCRATSVAGVEEEKLGEWAERTQKLLRQTNDARLAALTQEEKK